MQTGLGSPPKPKNLETIFITKGIAISLVVWAHCFYHYPLGYWPYLVPSFIEVAMPTFFFLSGYLMAYQGGIQGALDIRSIFANKAKRLIYPFITITLISFGIKVIASHVASLEHPVTAHSYFNVFIDPIHSHMPLLWYIYVVMIMFMAYPLLLRALRNPQNIFLVSLLLYFIPWPQIFSLSLLFSHLPFFALGFMLGLKYNLDEAGYCKLKYLLPVSAILLGSLYLSFAIENVMTNQLALLVVGFSGIAVMQIISKAALLAGRSKVLATIGYYSMSIYLLHTIFASTVQVGYKQILGVGPVTFPVSEFAAGVIGTIGPLLLEKYFLRKFSFPRKYILGLS